MSRSISLYTGAFIPTVCFRTVQSILASMAMKYRISVGRIASLAGGYLRGYEICFYILDSGLVCQLLLNKLPNTDV